MTQASLRSWVERLRGARGQYYLSLAAFLLSAGLAGAAAVAQTPAELGDPLFRAVVVAFFGAFAMQTFDATRDAWLELHGIDHIAADLGEYKDVDPWAAASLDDDTEDLAARARDLLDEVRDRVRPAADEKAALSEAIGTADGVSVLADRDELPEKQQLEGNGGSTTAAATESDSGEY